MAVTVAELIDLGVVQLGDDILLRPTRSFDLPTEQSEVADIWKQLCEVGPQVRSKHPTDKGLGISANQIGYDRRMAWFLPNNESAPVMLLNPQVVTTSTETDVQFEGCLSFFDVRGRVERPLAIVVENFTPNGDRKLLSFENADARLCLHEIDHLDGVIYQDRMHEGESLIPYTEYVKIKANWIYDS